MTGNGYEFEGQMSSRPNPYPTWTDDRGQVDASPFTQQSLEVNPQARYPRAKYHGSPVDRHRIEGATLDPGRVLTHPSRIVAPNLIAGNQPQTFDTPAFIIPWVPNPIVQRSYGQHTVAVDDIRHTTPKQLLGYSSEALSQQEIADAAALSIRKAMYGR